MIPKTPEARYIVKGHPEDGLDTLRRVFNASEGVLARPIQRNMFLLEVSREQQRADKIKMAEQGVISGQTLDNITEETASHLAMVQQQGFDVTQCDIVEAPREVRFTVLHDDLEALYIFAQAAQCKDGVQYNALASNKLGKAIFKITEDVLSRDLQIAAAQGRNLETTFHRAVQEFQNDLFALTQSGFSASISYPEFKADSLEI